MDPTPLVIASEVSFKILWHTNNENNNENNDEYHYVWLRDNCECGQCIHPSSKQKLHSSASIPIDIKPSKGEYELDHNKGYLKVKWNDGHTSTYSFSWLIQNAYSPSSLSKWHQSKRPIFWANHHITPQTHEVNFNDFMHDDKIFLASLKTFLDYGLLIVTDVPADEEKDQKEEKEKEKEKERGGNGITQVAGRIGPLRETFFGRTWEVVNVPQASNIAYTNVNLGLHQDLPYFESVPPVQILHCLVASPEGGESTFADSYHAAERLRTKYPKHFETLMRVPITFQYTNNGHNFVCQKPVLYSSDNLYIGVNFSPQNHGPMIAAPKDVIPFYEAYKQLSDEIYNSDLIYSKKMKSGDLVIFDNRRVLHGRNAFDTSAPRHLRGTYMGMDEVEDRYNTLLHSLNNKK